MKRIERIPEHSGAERAREHGKRPLVLYVEDDDQNWDVANLRLSESFAMLRAKNAEQACGVVRERVGELAAILMDIELRGSDLNGVQLTELFRGKLAAHDLPLYAQGLPAVMKPIIFVTAHGARYSDVELMLFGADTVIQKPVNFTSLNFALAGLQCAEKTRRTY